MINSKPATTDHKIHPLIANRWSPIAFSDKPVEKEKVMSLLEAARWAPSAYNEQPWQYIVGYKGNEIHSKLSECLFDGNSWAKEVPVLMMSVAKNYFDHGHKPNPTYMHDTGMATMNMVLQATEMDLSSHQMSGYDHDKAKDLFNISDEFETCSMIAIGYPGDPDKLDDASKERDSAPRQRKKMDDMIWT